MKQSAKVLVDRPARPRSRRRNAATSPVILSMPEEDRFSTMVLTVENDADGKSRARIWPSSSPCGVISPAVEHPA